MGRGGEGDPECSQVPPLGQHLAEGGVTGENMFSLLSVIKKNVLMYDVNIDLFCVLS